LKLPVLNAAMMGNSPTNQRVETELERWSRIYSGSDFYYGLEAGPVARRAVRYHQPLKRGGIKALDAGCGEGQDLLYRAQCGYDCTGIDFTSNGIAKAKTLLEQNGQNATLIHSDLQSWQCEEKFDLVLAVNCLQFLGEDAVPTLLKLKASVNQGGVIGLSMFARENSTDSPLRGTIYRWTLEELLEVFSDWQPFEAAKLWQWGSNGAQPFVTIVAGNLS
jgi:SAM-dependent methyltransferase